MPAAGSRGVYGDDGTVGDFLATQQIDDYLLANDRYATLLGVFRKRIAELVDFEIIEPREFWRIAVREALAETNFDYNPVIEVLFDPDSLGCRGRSNLDTVERHIRELEALIKGQANAAVLATAATMLAVSLSLSPAAAIP